VLSSCNQEKNISSFENTKSDYFIIGSGGGFTGQYTQYKVFNNGNVEIYDFSSKTYSQFKTADKSKLNDFFNSINSLELNTYKFNKPGNITNYIEVNSTNDLLNRIVWNKGSTEINPAVENLFNDIFEFIKSL